MSAHYLPMRVAATLLGCTLLSQAHPAEPQLPREGWVSWQTEAVDNAPAWCCYTHWKQGTPSSMSCRLDGGSDGFGIGNRDATTETNKVYARVSSGKLDRLQALSASCPVETKTPIQDLGTLTADDSARWLIAHVGDQGTDAVMRHPVGQSALAALAMHRGDLARDALAGFTRDPRTDTRKWSVFWLGMVRGNEGADLVSPVMFSDPEPEVREHAAMALSQSGSSRAAKDLVRLGNTDKSGDVRAKAWFWLAQSGAAEAEDAIGAAIRKDPDDEVREQGIFALSLLPAERATKALIGVAEDRSRPREQRKRAVFWLSQSESDAAQAYLDKVLARSAAS